MRAFWRHLYLPLSLYFALAAGVAVGLDHSEQEIPVNKLFEMPLGDLLNVKVITPSKIEETLDTSPAIVSVITRSDITNYGGNSLFDILDRAAGIFLYGSYYLPNNMITIRGEATSHYTTHVLMLINGRPFRSSKEGYLLPLLSAFPLDTIERIEIIRGSGSTLYGTTAYTGVINIITRKAEQKNRQAGLKVGSFGTRMASISTSFDANDFGFTFSANAMDEEGWNLKVRDADDQGELQPFVQSKAEEHAYAFYSSLQYKDFNINAVYGSNYINNGYQLQNVYNWPELNLGTDSAMIDIAYSKSVNEKYSVDVNLTHNYQHYWQPFDERANDDREMGKSRDYLLEVTQYYAPSADLSITLGSLVNYYTGHIENNEMLSNGSPYDVWTNPENPDPFQVVPKYNDKVYNIYLNSMYQITNKTKLIAGLHANKIPAVSSGDFSPRFGIVYKSSPDYSYKLLYSEAYRYPDNFELYSTIPAILGNQSLVPEKIKTLETEMLYGNDNLLVTASIFASRQKNLIARSNILETGQLVSQQFVNQGEINSWGIESTAKAKLSSALSLEASMSYHETDVENGNADPFGVPNLYVKLGLSYSVDAIVVGLFSSHYNYRGDAYGYEVLFPSANTKVKSFTFTTLNCNVDVNKLFNNGGRSNIIANIYITNLFDEKISYAEHGRKMVNSTPGRPGVGVYAGIKYIL